MEQKYDRYSELAEKWLNGTISPEELIEFSEWYAQELDDFYVPKQFAGSEEQLRKRILSAIQARQRRPVRMRRELLKVAAALFILIVSGFVVAYLMRSPGTPVQTVSTIQKQDSIVPGSNKAKLVLGDGTEVLLDTASIGTIGEHSSVKVIKLDDGQLSYSPGSTVEMTVEYNTLSTPRGGQYAITLCDGTKVWLNSVSSLRFPTAFVGKERVVELTGEGYFEVARQQKPFKVKVGGMEVNVLGTHFNIMAYEEEGSINTTLLEGSVIVREQERTAILIPGQQAQVRSNTKIEIIKNADVEQAVAWKNGVFNFNGSDIETTMRQIARWYDIEVRYDEKITEHFNGSIPRNVNIEKVLQLLEYTGVVNFRIQGRKIFVRS